MMASPFSSRRASLAQVCICMFASAALAGTSPDDLAASPSRISDKPLPLLAPDEVERPAPLLEVGNPFLAPGKIDKGFELPTGAVWQPSLMIFGTYRTAVQALHDGGSTQAEWANRLDLFANLQLSGTERILLGIRPLDKDGNFAGVNFGGGDSGAQDHLDLNIETLFFEGDLGEIFANADPEDRHYLDWGFSVGRQELVAQDGLLILDTVDAVGIVRNNILVSDISNLRATFVFGWGDLHRDDNRKHGGERMFALLTHADLSISTVESDLVYIFDEDGQTGGVFWGIGATQRVGKLNTTFRLVGSIAIDDESAAVSTGELFFVEVSWAPVNTHDHLYVNFFIGIDEFASAARGPSRGGPLGRVGILFAAVELGRYGAPLGNRADNAVGGAIGYQFLFTEQRSNLVLEMGARGSTKDMEPAKAAIAARYQQAIGQHFVLQLDLFGSIQESGGEGWGMRIEMGVQF